MADTWRLIDTGLRPAAQNIALDRALLEARRADEIPSTLRFQRFARCALIGCDRSPGQELDLDACHAGGVAIQRRLTGGGAMILDEGQFAWTLCLHRRDLRTADLRANTRRFCHATATAVSALGVDAKHRAHGEIEVDGRRLADCAGVLDGDALLFQGMLSIDLDAGTIASISRLAGAAPVAAGDRTVNLKELLAARPDIPLLRRYLVEAFESDFGVEFAEGDLTLSEQARYRAALGEIDHPDWIHLMSRPAAELPLLRAETTGGVLRVTVAYDRGAGVIRQAWFDTAVQVVPRRALSDLESVLRDVPLGRLVESIERFFAGHAVSMMPLAPADFTGAVQLAVGRPLVDRV